MREFTVHVESAEGLATDDRLAKVEETLTADVVLQARVAVDPTCDAYTATMRIRSSALIVASIAALEIFGRALQEAGHDRDAISRLSIVDSSRAPAVTR